MLKEETMGNEVVLYSEKEKELGMEANSIVEQAKAVVIRNDEDFTAAGGYTKEVKSVLKKVEEYWEPMRASTYAAYKAVTDHKKAMVDPLKKAESILKKKLSDYQVEKERKRKAEEEMLRRLAQEEMERKLAEAAEAESKGDVFGMEYAMAEAEVMDAVSNTASVARNQTKVEGISQTKTWEIKGIDLSKLPCEYAGIVIRPADEKAILKLIKDAKGEIEIPGVEFGETYSISVRAS